MVLKKLILFLFFLLTLTSVSATLDCQLGTNNETFFYPSIFEKRTISIPCILTTNISIVNASCYAGLYYEEDLISTYPEIKNLDYYGMTYFIEINENQYGSPFTVEFSNKDLINQITFNWEVTCRESPSGLISKDSGKFEVRYPFAELLFNKIFSIGWRDNSLIIFGAISLIVIVFVASLIWSRFK